mgnify:CR=1 FL=1
MPDRSSRAENGAGLDDQRPDVWKEIGRDLLRDELSDCRFALEEACYNAEEALGSGDELTAEHIHALRVALNRARERVERHLAPAAGVEPWGDPAPRIPMGVLWEWSNHPKAGGEDGE